MRMQSCLVFGMGRSGVLEGQVALAFLEKPSGSFKPAWGDMWSSGVHVSENALVEAELFLVP